MKTKKGTDITARWSNNDPNRASIHYDGRYKKVDLDDNFLRFIASPKTMDVTLMRNGYDIYDSELTVSTHPKEYIQPFRSVEFLPEADISGSVDLWTRANTTREHSLFEPSSSIASGERGYLVCKLNNSANTAACVTGISLISEAKAINVEKEPRLWIDSGSTAELRIPITCSSYAQPGIHPLNLTLNLRRDKEDISVSATFSLAVYRASEVQVRTWKKRKMEAICFEAKVGGEFMNGLKEEVTIVGQVSYTFKKPGSFSLTFRLDKMIAVVTLPKRASEAQRVAWVRDIPPNLIGAVPASWGDWIIDYLKAAFCVATGLLGAVSSVAALAVIKIAIAAAAQALGPAIGVPVTLVLFSPPVEKIAVGLLAANGTITGAMLNRKLLDYLEDEGYLPES